MAERIRAQDWSETTVGTPEQWPQELRRAVDEVLGALCASVKADDASCSGRLGQQALLQTAEEALRESEARYQTLFNSVDAGICIFEMLFDADDNPIDYRWLELNPTFEKQTGLVDAVGKSARELVPDLDDSWFEIYGKVAMTGEPVRFENHAPAMDRWFDVYAVRVGRPEKRQVALFFNNITEQKQVERSLREADRRKDHFMALLSHELRNPLAPIMLSLQLLDLVEAGSSKALEARAIIKRQVDQLTELVDDLLDVTRVTSGKIQLQRDVVELDLLLEHTVEDHRSLFESRDVTLEFERHDAPVYVDADRSRLAQVVGNLLHNAAKFTDPGGHTCVSLSVSDAPGVGGKRQVEIRVTDTGVGMSEETLPGLFEPFIQADTSLDHAAGGLGLGLALVKGLVELHGGEVSVSSAGLGEGAEFVVKLPLTDAIEAPSPSLAPDQAQAQARRVLIIEDNGDVAQSFAATLTMRGHDIEIASDGADGIARAVGFAPDVVFCDIGLPGMDGYEVARTLRANSQLDDTLLVALSGYATPADVTKARDAGFDRHIAKPPKLAIVEEAIAAAPVRHR
jgi:PAS domain S-box-containing protein